MRTVETLPILASLLDQLPVLFDHDAAAVFAGVDGAGSPAECLLCRGPIPPQRWSLLLREPGLAEGYARLIAGRTALVAPDANLPGAQVPLTEDAADSPRLCSWLYIPALRGSKIVGLLLLGKVSPYAYTPELARRARALAHLLGAAIETELFCRDTERRSREGEALFAVQQALSSRLDLDIVLQLIADEARFLTSTQSTLLMMLVGDRLRIAAMSGECSPDVYIGYEIPLDNSFTGASVLQKRPILVENARDNPQVYHRDHLRVRSFLSVPLLTESQAIGAILVADKRPGPFTEADERVVTMLAASAATAVENARLYQAEKDRRQEAERRHLVAEGLKETMVVLNSSRPLAEALEHIVRQACTLLGAETCALWRLEGNGSLVALQCAWGQPDSLRRPIALPAGWGGVGRAALTRQPVTAMRPVPRTDGEGAQPLDEAQSAFVRALSGRYSALIAVPLFVNREIYGELDLYYSRAPASPEEEVLLAKALADQASLALENAQLREQSEDLARLAERRRIAQVLHESVVQMLFAIGLEAQQGLEGAGGSPEVAQHLRAIQHYATSGAEELRSAIFALRSPTIAERHGLAELLEHLVAEFRLRSGVAATCFVSPELPADLPQPVAEAVYRIAREALWNVRKHAHATAAIVNLLCDERTLTITVQDDGVGLAKDEAAPDAAPSALHFGIDTMRHLSQEAHGSLTIANGDEQGVIVRAIFPIR